MPTSILLRADQVIEEACLLQRMSLFGAKRTLWMSRSLPLTRPSPNDFLSMGRTDLHFERQFKRV